jgi:serine/threonine protein kinase/WD40 repeat protein
LIEEHLEECEACQVELDTLASGDQSWPGRVKDLRRDPIESAPGLKRIMGVLKDDLASDPESTGCSPGAPGEILGFLDPPDAPGELGRLGPYRVLEILGEGGMGVVLKAVDPALTRTVAIKVLAPQLATSSPARHRFAREARAAAAIRNEHVVAIHSVDEWKGLPYLVMEFIPGASLQERIDRTSPMGLESILRIGLQAACGLAAAHAQGLVHRDIKPSNILLENCVERVKITDFGLARAVDDASLTQSGVVAGTPLYMAPEQARCETIDHRADLFSLGAVLYAMCTGRSPFRAPTTMGVLRRVCDDLHRPVREVNPEIPVELATVIDRLLAKDPHKRFQTSSDVADVLEQLLARRQKGWMGETEVPRSPIKPDLIEDVGLLKRPRHRRALQLAAYGLVLLSGVFVVAETTGTTKVIDTIATVLRIKTTEGTLVFEVFDPGMSVQVDGQRISIRGPGVQALTINPGAHRVDQVDAHGNVSSEWISISKGDRLQLRVGREPDQPRLAPSALPQVMTRREGLVISPLPSIPTLKTEVKGLRGILAFVHNGRYLVGGGPGAEIVVYDTSTKKFRSHSVEGGDVKALEVNDEIRTVLTASADGRVRFWDIFPLAEGDWPMKPHATPDLHGQKVTALALSKDSRLLALGGDDGKLVLWDRGTNIRDDLAQHLGHPVRTIRLAPDNSLLAVALKGSGVQLWSVVRERVFHLDRKGKIEDAPEDVQFLEFSHDGRFLAYANQAHLMIWDRQRGQVSNVPILSGGMSGISQLAFSPSATNLLAVTFGDGDVVLWNADSNCAAARWSANDRPISSLAFGTDGLSLATWSRGDESTKIWDLAAVAHPPISHAELLHDALVPPAVPAPPPLKLVEVAQIPVQQAIEQLQHAHVSKELATAQLQTTRAELEQVIAQADTAKRDVARVEKLHAQSAVSQQELERVQSQLALLTSLRHSTEAKVRIAEIKLRHVEDDLKAAQILLGLVSEVGTGSQDRREAILRFHAETAVRKAQLQRDQSAAELDVFKAALEQAVANFEYCKRASARIRRLLEQKAVPQRTADEAAGEESAAEAKLRLAQAEVAQAEAKLKAADQKLEDTRKVLTPPGPEDDASVTKQIEDLLTKLPQASSSHQELMGLLEELRAKRGQAPGGNDQLGVELEKRQAELRDRYELLKKLKDDLLRRREPESKVR